MVGGGGTDVVLMKIESGFVSGQVLQRLGQAGATANVAGETSHTGPVLATLQARSGVVRGWKLRPVGLARTFCKTNNAAQSRN